MALVVDQLAFCNLTKVDAIQYGLLFERFLNESRIGKGLADVDLDFETCGRDKVKAYMQHRFGEHNVAAIGTYNALLTKAALRDVLRFHGEQPQIINYYSAMIEEKSNDNFSSLFHETIGNPKLKEFMNEHAEAINDVPLILGQPKSSSIHASGVLITPEKDGQRDMQIYDWFPCKVIDGVLISEWEGVQLDDAGFLKADILGLTQLDKLHDMLRLIKDPIDLSQIDLEDHEVFELFKKGWTQDVFQFGTDGLSAYCREVKPTSIAELATINALYRPGAMDSGAHTDYVKIKFGKKEAEYDWGTEEITQSTFGLYVFQEQAIKIVQVVGGFTLTEGDGVRKATGKKLMDKMKSYKDKFVAGAIKNGCPEFEANKIWGKIEVFAGYSFNLSHAITYSIIGYQSQWMKKYYPLEFWTVALQKAKDKDIPKLISEMGKFADKITLAPPDINKSREVFYTDWENNTIYWSLSRIAQVGTVALTAIMEEREKNGKYFSIEEFVTRIKEKGGVNKRVVMHLILSGCFDELYQLANIEDRLTLMNEWARCYDSELPVEFGGDVYGKFFWYKQQRDLSGSGLFNYKEAVYEMKGNPNWAGHDVAGPEEVGSSEFDLAHVVVAGLVTEVIKRKTKKGEMGKITLDHNNDLIDVVVWNSEWERLRKKIEGNMGNAIAINGVVQWDNYNKKNCVYSDSSTDMEIFK